MVKKIHIVWGCALFILASLFLISACSNGVLHPQEVNKDVLYPYMDVSRVYCDTSLCHFRVTAKTAMKAIAVYDIQDLSTQQNAHLISDKSLITQINVGADYEMYVGRVRRMRIEPNRIGTFLVFKGDTINNFNNSDFYVLLHLKK